MPTTPTSLPRQGGIRVVFDTSDLTRVQAMLRRVLAKMPAFIFRRVENTADQQLEILRDITPVKTGRTVSTVRMIQRSPTTYTWVMGSDDENFMRLIYGTRPHTITPRFAQALWWPEAAHPVPRVHHPGQSPRNLIEEAVNQGERSGIYDKGASWILVDFSGEWHK